MLTVLFRYNPFQAIVNHIVYTSSSFGSLLSLSLFGLWKKIMKISILWEIPKFMANVCCLAFQRSSLFKHIFFTIMLSVSSVENLLCSHMSSQWKEVHETRNLLNGKCLFPWFTLWLTNVYKGLGFYISNKKSLGF